MTNEERREAVARLLKNAPDVLTPREVAKWTRYGKNTVYAMLKDGILPGYVFRGSYLVGKEDLIDFMVEHTDDIFNLIGGCVADDIQLHVCNCNAVLLFHSLTMNPFFLRRKRICGNVMCTPCRSMIY